MPDKLKRVDIPIIKNDTVINDDWIKIFPSSNIERKIIGELEQEHANDNKSEYIPVSS